MKHNRERIAEALGPYGFTITDQFWWRYHNDAEVHALVTIILGQNEAIREVAKEALEKGVEQGAERALALIEDRLNQVLPG